MPKYQKSYRIASVRENRLPIASSVHITGAFLQQPFWGQMVTTSNPQFKPLPPILEPSNRPKPIPEPLTRLILERTQGQNNPDVFGSLGDVNAIGLETLLPALSKGQPSGKEPRVLVGSKQCTQPYSASYLNGSALSFGPMGKKFILAINRAASQRGFFQNTGEAGLSPYHLGLDINIEAPDFDANHFFSSLQTSDLRGTGDVVWQLGNGYFGCRRGDGSFDPGQFRLKARLNPVKMIEIKLSQGVEPQARMPVHQVTRGMAQLMGLQEFASATLQKQHSAFSNAMELMSFVRQLRELSGGKPIGIKLGVSHRQEILALCKAMRRSGVFVDFITVDGMEAGTAAAQGGTLGFTGTPLADGVLFVHNALVGCRLREQIRIVASGKVFTEREMVCLLARGADLFATARGLMLAVGCDQQLECYKGTCPRGIATQDPNLLQNFPMEANINQMLNYHRLTLEALNALAAIAGLQHPAQLKPSHLQKRISYGELLPLDEVYTFLKRGALLTPFPWRFPLAYRRSWRLADPFRPFNSLSLNVDD